MRKTIKVSELVDQANKMLANSTCNPDMRKGIMAITNEFLHRTGNYRGFRFLSVSEVPLGHLPGIRHNPDGTFVGDINERFDDTDETRIYFYGPAR